MSTSGIHGWRELVWWGLSARRAQDAFARGLAIRLGHAKELPGAHQRTSPSPAPLLLSPPHASEPFDPDTIEFDDSSFPGFFGRLHTALIIWLYGLGLEPEEKALPWEIFGDGSLRDLAAWVWRSPKQSFLLEMHRLAEHRARQEGRVVDFPPR